MKRNSLCLSAVLVFAFVAVAALDHGLAAQPAGVVNEVAGTIKEVTVYRTQALVTREIEFPPGDGLRQLQITDLPDTLVADSVFAEGADGTAVRAVRVSSRVTNQSSREDVRQLLKEQEELSRELRKLELRGSVIESSMEKLDVMTNFSAEKASQDANNGTLQSQTLIELLEFAVKATESAADEMLDIEQKQAEIAKRQQMIDAELEQLTASDTDRSFVATVFIETVGDAAGKLRLSYRVDGCGWTPQYTIHGQLGSDRFQLRYGALVTQTSGETWDGVNLVLSTASATLNSAGPTLTPFAIKTSSATVQQQAVPRSGDLGSASSFKSQVKNLKQLQNRAETQTPNAASLPARIKRDSTLNTLAGEIQRLELLANADSARSMAPDATEEVSTQTYTIEKPVSLDSRRDQQLVQIVDAELAGEMYHVATPLLSSYAYRETELRNTESIGLMSGSASVYLDGRFVGQTTIPPTASGQRLIVGFGADQQIRTRRELLRKEDKVQGGNRNQSFDYRLVVANFKDTPVRVRVLDRMPVAKEAQSISVSDPQSKLAISEDALYLRVRRPTGILRWDVEVPASSFGGDAFDIDYSYEVEFDRNRQLTSVSSATVAPSANIDAFGFEAEEQVRDLFMGGFGGGMGGAGK